MDQQQLLAIFNGNGEGGAEGGETGGVAQEAEPDGEFANQEEPQ